MGYYNIKQSYTNNELNRRRYTMWIQNNKIHYGHRILYKEISKEGIARTSTTWSLESIW